MVRVPVREVVPVFADTVYDTVPLPLPLPPAVILSQVALLFEVREQVLAEAVTATLSLALLAEKL